MKIKIGSPEWFRDEFKIAAKKEGRAAYLKLRRKLEETVDLKWARNLFRLIVTKKIFADDEVCTEYLGVLERKNEGHLLLTHVITFASCHIRKHAWVVDTFSIFTIFLVRFPGITKQILERSRNDSICLINLETLLIRIQQDGIRLDVRNNAPIDPATNKQVLTANLLCRLSVPPELTEWAQKIVDKTSQAAQRMSRAINNEVPLITQDMIDELWQRIQADADYTLHLDGDKIDFRLARINDANILNVTLLPSGKFPNATLDITLSHGSDMGIIKATLENGYVKGIDHMWTDVFRLYLTYVICIGYHYIVTGEVYKNRHVDHHKGRGKIPGTVTQKRVARPHPVRLLDGQKPSARAREAFLKTFQRELLPGRTWRVPTKGAVIECHEATAVITDRIVELHKNSLAV